MRFNEIGSEFWINNKSLDPSISVYSTFKDSILLLSGRTALGLIADDLHTDKTQKDTIWMPAYCCNTMLEPLTKSGFKVKFYDIIPEEGKLLTKIPLSINKDKEIVYVCSYFGFTSRSDQSLINKLSSQNISTIWDLTHNPFDINLSQATFCFGSLRKWMGIVSGAFLLGLKHSQNILLNYPFCDLKHEAMDKKRRYIMGDLSIEKEDFLEKFKEFNYQLTKNYKNYSIDPESIKILESTDLESIISKRKENAKILFEGLKGIDEIKPLFSENSDAVPLFIPILVKDGLRDKLRSSLTNRSIYLPIHWPKTSLIPSEFKVNKLYNEELSIICDQRYGKDDMTQIINEIKNTLLIIK